MHETPTTSSTTPCAPSTATEEFDVHEAIALIHQHAKTSKKKKHVVALSMREGYLYGESTEALLQVLQPLAYIVGAHHIGKSMAFVSEEDAVKVVNVFSCKSEEKSRDLTEMLEAACAQARTEPIQQGNIMRGFSFHRYAQLERRSRRMKEGKLAAKDEKAPVSQSAASSLESSAVAEVDAAEVELIKRFFDNDDTHEAVQFLTGRRSISGASDRRSSDDDSPSQGSKSSFPDEPRSSIDSMDSEASSYKSDTLEPLSPQRGLSPQPSLPSGSQPTSPLYLLPPRAAALSSSPTTSKKPSPLQKSESASHVAAQCQVHRELSAPAVISSSSPTTLLPQYIDAPVLEPHSIAAPLSEARAPTTPVPVVVVTSSSTATAVPRKSWITEV